MKNKLMAILTLIAVAAMILTAPAVKASSKTYKVLDEVNFYAYEGDSVGTTTFIASPRAILFCSTISQ